ncbi:hypothetical protein DQ04_22781000 [Trypanosoma grayi]|uniref:hypothetical protein n=1 Tax=Trypanosoma grayi TaxID=71804 RepID=UPI0004F49591|nr:hypothetical protein DQ04_22781000 [Trypanosoma grayi]KEG05374.1 hypothetical protein DQ04_22781000 [Trypanosoma grayi]
MKLGFSLITIAVQVAVLGLMVAAMLVPTNILIERRLGMIFSFYFFKWVDTFGPVYPIHELECTEIKRTLQAGAAFSVISSVLSVAVVVLLILRGKFSGLNWAPRIAAMLCAIAILIAMIVIIVVRFLDCGEMDEMFGDYVPKDSNNRGDGGFCVGFTLVCVALGLEIVVVVLSFVF